MRNSFVGLIPSFSCLFFLSRTVLNQRRFIALSYFIVRKYARHAMQICKNMHIVIQNCILQERKERKISSQSVLAFQIPVDTPLFILGCPMPIVLDAFIHHLYFAIFSIPTVLSPFASCYCQFCFVISSPLYVSLHHFLSSTLDLTFRSCAE